MGINYVRTIVCKSTNTNMATVRTPDKFNVAPGVHKFFLNDDDDDDNL